MASYFTQPTSTPGISVAGPIFSGNGFAPGVLQMAREFSKAAQDNVSRELGQKGLMDSSAFQNTLARAFSMGTQQAVGVAQQEQARQDQYTQFLASIRAAQPRKPKWWETALSVGLPILSTVAAFKGK